MLEPVDASSPSRPTEPERERAAALGLPVRIITLAAGRSRMDFDVLACLVRDLAEIRAEFAERLEVDAELERRVFELEVRVLAKRPSLPDQALIPSGFAAAF